MPQQMKHPSGDVKVVPDELVAKYADRGWKKTTAKTSSSPSSATSTKK